jgi:tight adherence protein B
MPGTDTLWSIAVTHGIFVLVVISAFLVLETVFMGIGRRRRERKHINARLKVLARTNDREEALSELRRMRGMTAGGDYKLPIRALGQLVVQSGLGLTSQRLTLFMAGAGAAAGTLVFLATGLPALSALAAFASALFGPLCLVLFYRSRRLKRLEEQLPDAVDVMVRSLKAGHPIPVAVGIVGREMPDPIGSEFGMVADEMSYGMDLEEALGNMRTRTGQADLTLLVTAISIQSKTGGNLADLLSNLSRMLRERSRMRLKIRALSAEGRFSAIALSVIPAVIYAIVTATSPTYYSDVTHDPFFDKAIYLGAVLWLMGVFIMRRMVNFKF